MYLKLPLLAAVCIYLLFSLNGCPPGQSADESHADFGVALGTSAYLPKGWGWKPNSKVEISIFDEPDGPGSASSHWKKILDENVDTDGMFGFNSGAPIYPVPQKFCGDFFAVKDQTVSFMVKSLTTGSIRLREVSAHIYFTGEPCH
jgi:hypothetical protein